MDETQPNTQVLTGTDTSGPCLKNRLSPDEQMANAHECVVHFSTNDDRDCLLLRFEAPFSRHGRAIQKTGAGRVAAALDIPHDVLDFEQRPRP
jgi:hypothetical protein